MSPRLVTTNVCHFLLLTSAAILSACSPREGEGPLEPVIVWLIARPAPQKQEAFKEELTAWFLPFQEESSCGSLRVFPQVEVHWTGPDGAEAKETVVTATAGTLNDATQNPVQKLFGAQPGFDDTLSAAKQSIVVYKPTERVLKEALQFKGSEGLQQDTLAKHKYQLVFIRSDDKVEIEKVAISLKKLVPDAAENLLASGTSPDQLKTALIKSICAHGESKDALKGILLLDPAPIVGKVPKPIPVIIEPAASATPPTLPAVNHPAPAKTPSRDPVTNAPAPQAIDVGDCLPGTKGCNKISTDTLPKRN